VRYGLNFVKGGRRTKVAPTSPKKISGLFFSSTTLVLAFGDRILALQVEDGVMFH
jgi:hypothetical protein